MRERSTCVNQKSSLLPVVRKTRPGIAARPRLFFRPAVRHRGVADPGVRRESPSNNVEAATDLGRDNPGPLT